MVEISLELPPGWSRSHPELFEVGLETRCWCLLLSLLELLHPVAMEDVDNGDNGDGDGDGDPVSPSRPSHDGEDSDYDGMISDAGTGNTDDADDVDLLCCCFSWMTVDIDDDDDENDIHLPFLLSGKRWPDSSKLVDQTLTKNVFFFILWKEYDHLIHCWWIQQFRISLCSKQWCSSHQL